MSRFRTPPEKQRDNKPKQQERIEKHKAVPPAYYTNGNYLTTPKRFAFLLFRVTR
jgi:hypothetical protein